jgi:hypothetical protein
MTALVVVDALSVEAQEVIEPYRADASARFGPRERAEMNNREVRFW